MSTVTISPSTHTKRLCGWIACTAIAAFTAVALLWFGNQAWYFVGGLWVILLLAFRDGREVVHKLTDRQDALRQVAHQMEFEFETTPSSEVNLLGWPETFRLTEQASRIRATLGEKGLGGTLYRMVYRARNVMTQTEGDSAIAIFDLEHPSQSREDVTLQQTVLAIRSQNLEMPHFAFFPSHSGDRIARWFSSRVDLRGDYRVHGNPPEKALDLLEQLSRRLGGCYCLEAGDGFLLIYRDERANRCQTRVEPKQIPDFLQQGLVLCDALTQPSEIPGMEPRPEPYS